MTWKKVWRMNRLAKGLLMLTTTLDGFSLANCKRFTKFAKLSTCQTFPLYSICECYNRVFYDYQFAYCIYPIVIQAITKHAFSQWRMKCLSVQGARENVKSLMHKELLQHYFDSWRNTVISCNSLRCVILNGNYMILQCVSCL